LLDAALPVHRLRIRPNSSTELYGIGVQPYGAACTPLEDGEMCLEYRGDDSVRIDVNVLDPSFRVAAWSGRCSPYYVNQSPTCELELSGADSDEIVELTITGGAIQSASVVGDDGTEHSHCLDTDGATARVTTAAFVGDISFGGYQVESDADADFLFWPGHDARARAFRYQSAFTMLGCAALSSPGQVVGGRILSDGVAGTIDLGGTIVTAPGTFGSFPFLARFDANDSDGIAWTRVFGSSGSGGWIERVDRLAGDLLVFGGANNLSVGGASINGLFLARLTAAAGNHVWSRALLTSSSGTIFQSDLQQATSATAAVVSLKMAASDVPGSVNLGAGVHTIDPDGSVIVGRFNASGATQWSKQIANSGIDNGGLALGPGDEVIVSGRLGASTVVVDGQTFDAGTTYACFLARFGADGTLSWFRTFPGCSLEDVEVLSSGDVIAVGDVSSQADFGAGRFDLIVEPGYQQRLGVALRMTESGEVAWAFPIGEGTGASALYEVELAAEDTVLVQGTASGVLAFGQTSMVTSGDPDLVVLTLAHVSD
jgi:hypothetical protein